jgi:hypothetical protein
MDRPSITSARIAQSIAFDACRQRLKAMPQSDRPESASIDDVRTAAADAAEALTAAGGSVAAVDSVACPCERLGAAECLWGGA